MNRFTVLATQNTSGCAMLNWEPQKLLEINFGHGTRFAFHTLSVCLTDSDILRVFFSNAKELDEGSIRVFLLFANDISIRSIIAPKRK